MPAPTSCGFVQGAGLESLPVPVHLRVVPRDVIADPRFEGGGGSSKLNYDIFRKAYGFLGTYQDSEIEELKKSLKKEKNQVSRTTLVILTTHHTARVCSSLTTPHRDCG